MRQGRHIGLVAVVLTLALASPAFGGTAYVSGRTLHYTTASSGPDSLQLSIKDGIATIGDGTLGTVAGAGCAQEALYARCLEVDDAVIELGSGGGSVDISLSSQSPVKVIGGAGGDHVRSGGSPLVFEGGPGADSLETTLQAGAADSFSGGPGRDFVYYTARKTPVNVSLDDVANDGGAGEHDNIHSDVEGVEGGEAGDVLEGGTGDDLLFGRSGDDTLRGLGGDDVLDGAGNGSCGIDSLDGGADDDTLSLSGDTTAVGGPGDDRFVPRQFSCGPNVATGGPGTDTADFTQAGGEDVWVSLDGVADDGAGEEDNYHADIENITAGDGGMVLIGNDRPNVLRGGRGDDLLDGDGGADTLIGGLGVDVADYSLRTAPVSLTLDGLANDGESGEGDSIAGDVEVLVGGDGADVLRGDGGDNILDGGPGPDLMLGGGGFDAVDYSYRTAAVHADLDGEPGDDGEPGESDTIGADVSGLWGGAGADILVGNALDGFLAGEGGNDTLTDPGGEDLLEGGAGDDAIDSDDGASDLVACGSGTDAVHRDALDEIDGDCETVTPAITAGPSPTPTPTPIAMPAAAGSSAAPPRLVRPAQAPLSRIDRVAPKATVRVDARPRSSRVRSLGLAVALTCGEPCAATMELRASAGTIRALRRAGVRATGVLARGSVTSFASTTRTVRVRPSTAGRPALRQGTYVLTVTIRDSVGNARRLTRTLKFR